MNLFYFEYILSLKSYLWNAPHRHPLFPKVIITPRRPTTPILHHQAFFQILRNLLSGQSFKARHGDTAILIFFHRVSWEIKNLSPNYVISDTLRTSRLPSLLAGSSPPSMQSNSLSQQPKGNLVLTIWQQQILWRQGSMSWCFSREGNPELLGEESPLPWVSLVVVQFHTAQGRGWGHTHLCRQHLPIWCSTQPAQPSTPASGYVWHCSTWWSGRKAWQGLGQAERPFYTGTFTTGLRCWLSKRRVKENLIADASREFSFLVKFQKALRHKKAEIFLTKKHSINALESGNHTTQKSTMCWGAGTFPCELHTGKTWARASPKEPLGALTLVVSHRRETLGVELKGPLLAHYVAILLSQHPNKF